MNMEVKHSRLRKKIKLPHLGQRIIKTAVAVFLCLLIYWLRGYNGLVEQTTVAAIICIQPYRTDSIETSINRIIGTFLGAGWALLFLFLMDFLIHHGIHLHIVPIYFIMAAGVAITLYTTVVLKKTETASLAAIVYICILATYPDVNDPFIYSVNRMIDTIIGILVAGAVNYVSLPMKKHDEYLFFIRLHDLVPSRYSHVSTNVLVILNRLYDDGARICLVSEWAPAFMLSQMGSVNVNVPVIVMDGAATYDIENRQFMNTVPIRFQDARFLCTMLVKMGRCYAALAVRDSSLMIYRGGNIHEAEKHEYEMMKRSPYRNYVDGQFTEEDKICFIRVIDTHEIIEELESRVHDLISENRFRILKRPQHRLKGYSGLYFYHPDATTENAKEALVRYESEKRGEPVIPVDIINKDKYTTENDAIDILNKTRHMYETIKLPWN